MSTEPIRQTLERYFYALDARDFVMLGACFVENARAEYDSGGATAERLDTRDAIVMRVRGIESCDASTHALASVIIEVGDADSACADTFAIAHLLIGNPRDGRIIVRGLRYKDRLVRTPVGWQIDRRTHMALWQYEVPAQPSGVP